jgi:hypothetical protein
MKLKLLCKSLAETPSKTTNNKTELAGNYKLVWVVVPVKTLRLDRNRKGVGSTL